MDYFSKFEDKLKQRLELESELSEFPLLSAIEKSNAFVAPANYFESIENSLEHAAELAPYSRLQSVKPLVFNELEVEYKQHLQSAIYYKIELAEELKSYETLYSLDKVNAFFVSENYFETVGDQIKEKIFRAKETKVSVLDTLLDFIFGKTMAFSFGLTLIIGLALYFYQAPRNIMESGDCKTLACLERNEILNNTKEITNFDEDQLMDLVDVNSLNQQLNSTNKEKGPSAIQGMDSISEEDLLNEL
ncbi:MAG: hypothetical protein K0S26_2784, partial [Bacteroidota bacterium]|nr:hypothetical protein [Bacteroidota bacterium]